MKRLLTEKEVAEFFGMKPEGVRGWRKNGRGPAWGKIGRLVRYRQEDVEEYVREAMTVERRPEDALAEARAGRGPVGPVRRAAENSEEYQAWVRGEG